MSVDPRAIARAIHGRYKARHTVKMPLLNWIVNHNLHLRSGVPWALEGREYLKEPILAIGAGCPEVTARKAAQVGFSAGVAVPASLYYAEQQSAKTAYYFPTDAEAKDFVQDRVDGIIDNTPYLKDINRDIAKKVENKGLKKIGGGMLYFRGSDNVRKVKSIDADLIILDELDEAKPEVVAYANDRILASSLGCIIRLSQPTFDDYGISKEFKKGSQEHWFIKCQHCGHYQAMELELLDNRYPKNFMVVPQKLKGGAFDEDQTYYRGCIKCHKPLDMAAGEWVAKYPGRKKAHRSFCISQLYSQIERSSSWVADRLMKDLMAANTSYEVQRAVVSIIGTPYEDENMRPITDTVLKNATGSHTMQSGGKWCYMGVDVGDKLHVVIAEHYYGRFRVVWVEETQDWARLNVLMHLYNVRNCIIDAMPYKNSAKSFATSHPKRVYLQYFKNTEKTTTERMLDNGEISEVPVIHVDRTASLDATVAALQGNMQQEPTIILPAGSNAAIDMLHKHLKNLIKEKDAKGSVGYKHKIENHLGMALNSMRLAQGYEPASLYVGVPPIWV